MIPSAALQGLTAEDFRLLLNGCPAIDVQLLKTCTHFVDESGRSNGYCTFLHTVLMRCRLDQTRKWFWQIVERMTDQQQHDLIYFWTSAPVMSCAMLEIAHRQQGLPATEAGFVPKPNIVVRPPSDQRLPSANTCASRLEIPLYPSRKVIILHGLQLELIMPLDLAKEASSSHSNSCIWICLVLICSACRLPFSYYTV